MAAEGEDGLVHNISNIDMRHSNEGRPGDRFKSFWDQLEIILEEVIIYYDLILLPKLWSYSINRHTMQSCLQISERKKL